MVDIFCSPNEEHEFSLGHYENSLRILVVLNYFLIKREYRLMIQSPKTYNISFIKELISKSQCNRVLSQFKIPEEIYCINCDKFSIGGICLFCKSNDKLEWKINSDTYFTSKSSNAVNKCIEILLTALDNVKNGRLYQYCLVRPPGYHCFNKAMGFCLVNNVFILSEYAIINGFSRVLILDYDYHHADGTAKLVKGKLDRYLISIHAYGNNIFPGTGNIDENDININNIPLYIENNTDSKFYTDSVCYEIFKTLVIPKISEYNPDIILISNGLDSHKDDPLAGLNLTEKFYVDVTTYLKSLNIPLIYVLEGGYNPNVIRDVSIAIIDTLK